MLLIVASMAVSFFADRALKSVIRSLDIGWSKRLVGYLALVHSRHFIRLPGHFVAGLVGLFISGTLLSLLDSRAAVQMCFGIALGGAAANHLDTQSRSGVVNCFAFRQYLAFNLADVAISVGICMGLAFMIAGDVAGK